MSPFPQKIVDALDALMSTELRFATNFWWLIWLPAYPFALALFLLETPSTKANIIFAAMLLIMAPWAIFLLRRRGAIKRGAKNPR